MCAGLVASLLVCGTAPDHGAGQDSEDVTGGATDLCPVPGRRLGGV